MLGSDAQDARSRGLRSSVWTISSTRFDSRLLIVSSAGTMSARETLETRHLYFGATIIDLTSAFYVELVLWFVY